MSEIVTRLRLEKSREKPCMPPDQAYPCADNCPCALRDMVIEQAARIEALEAERDAAFAAGFEACKVEALDAAAVADSFELAESGAAEIMSRISTLRAEHYITQEEEN